MSAIDREPSPDIQLHSSTESAESDSDSISSMAGPVINRELATIRRDRIQQMSWSQWGRNWAYRIGVAIFTAALYPFSAKAGAFRTYSCLEEFLEPFCTLSQKAGRAIFKVLVNEPEVCSAMQRLIDKAYRGDEEKVMAKYRKLKQLLRDKPESETILSVAKDVKELGLIRKKLRELPDNVDQMKQAEERQRWAALSRIAICTAKPADIKRMLEDHNPAANKVKRLLVNLSYMRKSHLDLQQVDNALRSVTAERESIEAAVCLFMPDEEGAASIAAGIAKELAIGDSDIEHFCSCLEKLSDHLNGSIREDCREANREVTRLYRDLLQTRVYMALKENPENLLIQSIHRLAVAIWNDVHALKAYSDLGGRMLAATGGFKTDSDGISGEKVVENLTETHRLSSDRLDSDLGWSFVAYGVSNLDQVGQSMASHGGVLATIAAVAGHENYDPHMQANNTPSLQGVTHSNANGLQFCVNNCYGGSPTIGDEIAPEFIALLQAIENNQNASTGDASIPDHLLYNNMQNINLLAGENRRSRAIMQLNFRFPQVFTGITMPKDSRFYQTDHSETPRQFALKMKQALMNPSAFSLESRTDGSPDDHGFYFSPFYNWELLFDQVLEVVTRRFESTSEWSSGAFQEYFYTLMQSALESGIAKKIASKKERPPKIMAVRACKENIDRGGVENTKYIWYHLAAFIRSGKVHEALSLLVGVFHSRALSVRKRMIHMPRAVETFKLMRLVNHQAFHDDLKALGIDQADFEPAF